jgi:hypothetical protein
MQLTGRRRAQGGIWTSRKRKQSFICCRLIRVLYLLLPLSSAGTGKLYLATQRTAKTKYRYFETNIPRKGISGPQSQFPHSCVCEPFIYFHVWSAILLEEICRPRLYKSLIDTWMLKLGLRPRYSQKRNTYMGFSLQCGKTEWERAKVASHSNRDRWGGR